MKEQSTHNHTYFYGFHSRKYYKIFITNDGIYGAKIAGTIPDAIMADIMLPRNPAGFFLEPVYNKKIMKRHEKENEIDQSAIENKQILQLDKKNFFWKKEDITVVSIQPKMSSFTWPAKNSGTIIFQLQNKKKKPFIIYPEQNLTDLTESFENIIQNVKTNK
ncbi:hypothetical protein [Alkalihalobacterium alkalinitrilicum]|uniref:hypothetical protein n=1 Tax=Alkalihalobacterium alkalinitrilicum TaxID=427920 RepID=UPI000994BA98|nr:hypothetical protein [Alkalihalobacterium alkalinitrilicum]